MRKVHKDGNNSTENCHLEGVNCGLYSRKLLFTALLTHSCNTTVEHSGTDKEGI